MAGEEDLAAEPPENAALAALKAPKPTTLHVSPSHSVLDALTKGASVSTPVVPVPPVQKPSVDHKTSEHSQEKEIIISVDSADAGLFATARWSSPSLPQYHPRQLIELLNAGA